MDYNTNFAQARLAIKIAQDGIDQVAREIYYSLSYLKKGHLARANLELALKQLGVSSPMDIGLSNSVLIYKGKE